MSGAASHSYRLSNDDILYFLHIPKTAGTTARYLFETRYDREQICVDGYHFDQFLALPPGHFDHCRFLAGHIFYDAYQWLPKPPVFVTFLRHPVDRFLSLYYFIQKFPDHPLYGQSQRMTPAEFALHTAFNPTVNNTASHLIGLPLSRTEASPEELLEIVKNSEVNEEIAKNAQERLKSFAFIGLAEQFQESLYLLTHDFGFPLPKSVSNHNINRRRSRDQLQQADWELIAEINKYDMKLYEVGKAIFMQRYVEMESRLVKRDYYRRAPRLYAPVKEIHYVADQPINGVGWHRSAVNRMGDAFRWTGPDTTSTFDVRIAADGDMQVEFVVLQAITPEVMQSIQLWVNGVQIPLKRKRSETRRGIIFSGEIPHHMMSQPDEFTRLELRVSATQMPVDRQESDDRLLGIALHSLSLMPIAEAEPASPSTPAPVEPVEASA